MAWRDERHSIPAPGSGMLPSPDFTGSQSSEEVRPAGFMMRYLIFTCVIAVATFAPAQQASEQEYCRMVTAGSQHAEALQRFCMFVATMQERLPDVICQETMKTSWRGSPAHTVTAEVRHREGIDSYGKITMDGKPFNRSMSELPGTWSEGEFGSVLALIFAEASHPSFKFVGNTLRQLVPALLFEFRVTRENNHSWSLQAGRQKVFPGIKGKFLLDASSSAVLRLEMVADDVPSFPLHAVKKSVDYANIRLGDGTEFVLPTDSEERKCLDRIGCFHEQLTFQDCHKFAAKSRVLDDVQ